MTLAIFHGYQNLIQSNCKVTFSEPPTKSIPILKQVKGNLWAYTAKGTEISMSLNLNKNNAKFK